jgi:hypothetical protein
MVGFHHGGGGTASILSPGRLKKQDLALAHSLHHVVPEVPEL